MRTFILGLVLAVSAALVPGTASAHGWGGHHHGYGYGGYRAGYGGYGPYYGGGVIYGPPAVGFYTPPVYAGYPAPVYGGAAYAGPGYGAAAYGYRGGVGISTPNFGVRFGY
jgi:hypothetical protein